MKTSTAAPHCSSEGFLECCDLYLYLHLCLYLCLCLYLYLYRGGGGAFARPEGGAWGGAWRSEVRLLCLFMGWERGRKNEDAKRRAALLKSVP
jgi:hypothetical protein